MNRRVVWIGLLACLGALAVFLQQSGKHSRTSPNAAPRVTREIPTTLAPAELVPEPAQEPVLPAEAVRSPVTPGTSGPQSELKHALGKTTDLQGRVVDDLGQPAAGVRVVAIPVMEEKVRAELEVDSVSSADGTYSIRGLLPGQWQLTAHGRRDRRSAPIVVSVPDERAPPTLMLPRSAIVAGIVVDALGRPLADADIHLGHAGENFMLYGLHGDRRARARTDASGRFRIEDVLPGMVELMASKEEHADSGWLEIAVAPGSTREDVRIELGTGGRIEGSIDPSLGEIAHRQVSLSSFNGSVGWLHTESDASGHFVMEGVIPQAYAISLMQTTTSDETIEGRVADVHVSTRTSARITKNITVEVGRTTEVIFGGPERSIVVRGTITSAGQVLPGADVSAAPEDGIPATGSMAATGLDGRYELTVPDSGTYRFDVSIDNDSSVVFQRAVPAQDVVEFSFTVPSGAISGRVVGADGQPLRRVPITVLRDAHTDTESFYGDCYRRMRTKDDGSFAFRLLAPGSYTLRAPDGAQHDNPPPRVPHGRSVLADLEVDASEVSGIELRLPPESQLSGVVVDGGGSPVAGAWIWLLDEQGLLLSGDWETQSDATGHFEVASVAPGIYTVVVQTLEAEASSAPIQFEAGKTATTRVELR